MTLKALLPAAIRVAITLLVSSIAVETAAIAQGTTATILGTAKDESGAVVPGVTITVTNVGTGISRMAITGDSGEYHVPALAIGTYNVDAELSGFKKIARTGITLQVGQEAVVSFTLPVGDSSQEVNVTEGIPLIEATTATISAVV